MMTIEQSKYKEFLQCFGSGQFMAQRKGQAFYSFFSLEKCDQYRDACDKIWLVDDEKFEGLLFSIFDIH